MWLQRFSIQLRSSKKLQLLLFIPVSILLLSIVSRGPALQLNSQFVPSFSSNASFLLNAGDDSQLNVKNPFPGKCIIPNYDQIRNMAIVYTWVNGSLPCYRKMRVKYGGKHAVGGSRDREIGELKYSIRSLRKNLPWHKGPIYIVTPGHIPHWLDLKNPKIRIVNQDDLFPDYAKKFLPTFNTHVIEQFLYLIPGLTDIYMQVNDDYLFAKPLTPHDFFTCQGGIKILQERSSISHKPPTKKKGIWISSVLNTQQEMDLAFGKEDRKFIKHAPFVYSRRAFERVHMIFDRPLYTTLKSKFRGKPDMNMPLLHNYYMVHQGYEELNIHVALPSQDEMRGYQLIIMKDNNMKDVQQYFDDIRKGKYKIVALNDEYNKKEVADRAAKFYESFLPDKTEFELDDSKVQHIYSIRNPDTCKIDYNILPPRPPVAVRPQFIKMGPQPIVVTYREIRWVSFLNAFVRGIGAGLGLIFSYLLFQSCTGPRAKFRKSNPYDKV